ncbi:hypothetical protein D1AOALGA4SA_9698 [Olavius algarvensis Delta 1 endosymbiont]|nr:hypothetical protein D1AOALGA4SA_9698 [Olavius algarvensis Delta 1 endosymbiont]
MNTLAKGTPTLSDNIRTWYLDKTVCITGATSGIGLEIARLLAGCRARLLLCGRDRSAMDAIVTELRQYGSVEDVFLPDLANPQERRKVLEQVTGTRVDILINNAGVGYFGAFDSMDVQTIESMLELNIAAMVQLCRAFIPDMRRRQGTGILNIGSVASYFGTPGSALYGASKHFVLGFTQALHQELRDSGIHVTGVYPGNTRTRFLSRATGGRLQSRPGALLPETVAREALIGLRRNKLHVIPGFGNKKLVLAAILLPARFILQKVQANAEAVSRKTA